MYTELGGWAYQPLAFLRRHLSPPRPGAETGMMSAEKQRVDIEGSQTTCRIKAKRVSAKRRACPLHSVAPLAVYVLIRHVVLASLLTKVAMGAGPTMQAVEDIVIKACADRTVDLLSQCPSPSSCQDGEASLVLGHSDPTQIGSLDVTVLNIDPPISSTMSPLRGVVARPVSGQQVITACPKAKKYGRSNAEIKITDSSGKSIQVKISIVVQPLSPVFDDSGPTR